MLGIEIRRATKRHGARVIFHELSLGVEAGDCVGISGPTGAGKTTLLRVIAGLDTLDAGEIRFSGRSVDGVAPHARDVNMAFQDFALWPHMTVRGHLEFVLQERVVARGERNARIDGLLDAYSMRAHSTQYPPELSGGEQQRLGIARAVATGPSILLLDEPVSNQNAAMKRECLEQIRREQLARGMTVVIVTHHPEELAGIATEVFGFESLQGA